MGSRWMFFFSLVSQITSLSVYSVYGWEEACEKDLCSLLLVSPLWSWFCQFCLESSSFLHQSLDCTDCHYFLFITPIHGLVQCLYYGTKSFKLQNKNSGQQFPGTVEIQPILSKLTKPIHFFNYWIFSLLIFQMSSPFQVPPPRNPLSLPLSLASMMVFLHPPSEQGAGQG